MYDLNSLRAEAERLAQLLPDPDVNFAARATVHHGAAGRRRSGRGEQFWQYRRYAQTDAAEQVDWRRSARGDELFVRETEMESARTFLFWSDPNPGFHWTSGNNHPAKSDRANAILLSLAIKLAKSGERVGSFTQGRRTGMGRAAADRLAEDLFAKQPNVPMPQKHTMATVIASDFYDPIEAWQTRLHPIGQSCEQGVLFQVRDPVETGFPFQGRRVQLSIAHHRLVSENASDL
ncbi:MAG: DUF58 domain-containing protein, partial [Pseudomonadota bacterium]